MIKGVTQAHLGPIWHHSEPSDVPYSSKTALNRSLHFNFKFFDHYGNKDIMVMWINGIWWLKSNYENKIHESTKYVQIVLPDKQLFIYHICGTFPSCKPLFWYLRLFLKWSLFCNFWSWVLERSLERKKRGSADIKNLLDFAIFSNLSYQCDIIRYNHIISQSSLYNFSKFSL